MSPALGWTVVGLIALAQVVVVVGTIHLAKVLAERSIRRAFAPLEAELAEYRARRQPD